MALDTAVRNIIAAGKKPTILIPSRGAVPIFLIAESILESLDPDNVLVDPQKTSYYPSNIFEYLSNGRIGTAHPGESEVDVILYPFTADVSTEIGRETKLAETLRTSCVRAFLDITLPERSTSLDLKWYFFLMSKMRQYPGLVPETIVGSLKSIPRGKDREFVLIDTVISGRAASNITGAFESLGQPVTAILAVDTSGDRRFRKSLKAAITRNVRWTYMGKESSFVEFPLISEDKGAALLGVAALNFSCFNEPGFFNRVDGQFSPDFLPQSCVWILPPPPHGEVYKRAFHAFLERCLNNGNGQPDWAKSSHAIKSLIVQRGSLTENEIRAMITCKKWTTARETSSHIVSIHLTRQEAEDWVRQFAATLNKRN